MKIVFATLLGLLFFGAQQSALPSRGLVLHAPKLVVTRYRLRAPPVAVTATPEAVWVVVETQGMKAQLRSLDSSNGRVRFSALIGRSGPDFGAAAEADGVVFAAAGDHVIRVAAATAGVRRASVAGEAAAIAIGFDSVWVASIGQQRDWVTRLNATTLAVEARIPLAVQPVALRAAFGSVWLATTESLQKISPATDRLQPTPVLTNNPIWPSSVRRAVVALPARRCRDRRRWTAFLRLAADAPVPTRRRRRYADANLGNRQLWLHARDDRCP